MTQTPEFLAETFPPREEIELELEIQGPISSTPVLGARKRKNNRQIGQFIEQQGDLKNKQLKADIENKNAKTDMFLEIKEYYKAKRQVLQISNQIGTDI